MNLFYKAQTRFLFHAHIKIKISAFYDDSIFDELFAVLEETDKKYNSYQPGSYIDLINKHAGEFVEVDDETISILKKVIHLSDFFGGAYDITIMPLIRLWGFYKNEQRRIPAPQEIAEVRQSVDYKRIEIEGNSVRIGKEQEIITGSFIKAYAVDKLIGRMKEKGINDAIVNAGGSTIAAINNEAHPSWQVMVRNPESEALLFKLNIADQCYSTSSQSTSFVEIDGKRYGHILNAKTGFPSENKQIGIISDSCMLGDIVSTGLFNETAQVFSEKTKLLSEHYNIEGFIIDENDNITYTKALS
ncbi:thiamine biosynthesis lipoprotein [Dysgonomonas sp. PFB1-18]|uniref:FAD:protein FMN transferase n=1 Tax=unclassified Dysgonomonas TaxID=2630389 RepID=UPI002474E8B5|nr:MULTISPECIES: FAD:protein FMN transferase [unclassified Dysgonomonas]MDH6308376.1 thiamine biosynthesis lipoprotein [Dysgonomonas sp. PF1-14]MDH6338187.1 thiamine biosynthesis lipoprotein [Dysgonomonas sp. PF1-16]MDH6379684.1 thiamine biosynthesis lipoprotein [Dysgonomonas sp. PFB1-18]MDH6397227.1 thiamine biosynthesis lipoprotein [Dysgonomonas sp. PF1-23]